MGTTVERISFCVTNETRKQLDDLCRYFGENRSQAITRVIERIHYSLRFPNVPLNELPTKEE